MTGGAPSRGIRVAGVALSLPVLAAAGCAVVGAFVLLRDFFPTAMSVFAPSAEAEAGDPFAKYLEEHEKLFQASEKRWEGRYVFFDPPKPIPPKPKVVEKPKVEEKPPEPVIQPAPATYGGQKPTGIFGDIVFFGTDRRLKVGEKSGDIEVIDIKPPFEVKIGWTKAGHHRGEYMVSFWDLPVAKGFDAGTNPFPKTASSGFKEGTTPAGGADGASGRPGALPAGVAGGRDPAKPDPSKPDPTKPDPSKPGDIKPPEANAGAKPEGKPGDPAAAPAAPPPANDPEGGPTEGGAQPETQPANRPQRRYPPGQAPKSESNAEAAEDGKQAAIQEPIPQESLPPFRSEGEIKGMNKVEAAQALQEINKTLGMKNLDSHNRARLEVDAKLIAKRLQSE